MEANVTYDRVMVMHDDGNDIIFFASPAGRMLVSRFAADDSRISATDKHGKTWAWNSNKIIRVNSRPKRDSDESSDAWRRTQ